MTPAQRTLSPLALADTVRFAGASGDFNPMHFDDAYARKNGFPGVFAMGMYVAGTLIEHAATVVAPAIVRRAGVRFVAPTWIGDALDLTVGAESADGEHAIEAAVAGAARVTGTLVTGSDPVAASAPTLKGEPAAEYLAAVLSDVVLPVEHGQIIQFARAVQAENEVYLSSDAAHAAGFSAVPAPLAFACTAAHWSGGNALQLPLSLGLNVARVVHGEHAWWFTRRPLVGDVLTGNRRVSAAYRKLNRAGGTQTFVAVDTDFRDQNGGPVLHERITLIELPEP